MASRNVTFKHLDILKYGSIPSDKLLQGPSTLLTFTVAGKYPLACLTAVPPRMQPRGAWGGESQEVVGSDPVNLPSGEEFWWGDNHRVATGSNRFFTGATGSPPAWPG